MAKELLTTLDDIKQDKDTNLIPENLREGIKTLGIEGIMVQGATKYEELPDKPSINDVTLEGNKTTTDLKLNYEELLNLPTLNGIDLKGALTTVDLNLDYDDLNNTPTINNVPLTGNLSTSDLNLGLSYNDLSNIPTLNGIELTGELTTSDLLISYNDTSDKPKINGKELTGDVSLTDIGIEEYVLPTAGLELGGVKTTSEVSDPEGYTATPIIDGVVYYKDTDTTYENATSEQSGLMSNTDKSKLDELENYDDSKITGRIETLETDILNKVDKEEGKGLSSEDYTKIEKDKLASLENYVLSPATQETLGGIKVGENLTIDETGLLNAIDTTYNEATIEGAGLLSASDKEKLDSLQNYDDKEIKDSITNLSNNVYKKNETYSQEQIDSKLSGAYIYRGSKLNREELPGEGNVQGDVYNLQDSGMNVAWDGEDWDNLGSIFDTTKIDKDIEDLQAKDIELQTALDSKVDVEEGKGLSTVDFTTEYETKLKGIEDEANKTVIVDNLESTATDQALSANQGKELKVLIDGKGSGSYTDLTDKPSINEVELDGAETFESLGMETEYKPLYIPVTIETTIWQASGKIKSALNILSSP